MRVDKNKTVLDCTCGARMMWFKKDHPNVLFTDRREELNLDCNDGRFINVKPDVVADFRNLPFKDASFKLVVFDPPHIDNLGKNSWLAKKYGILSFDWRTDLKEGFNECMRVLKKDGVLIFKWSESRIKVKDVLSLFPSAPLFGHRTGKSGKTIWLTFMKET